jgi:hypothetical protein
MVEEGVQLNFNLINKEVTYCDHLDETVTNSQQERNL